MPVTIRDVARAAGVSEATVSRALRGLRHVSPDTEQRVRAAAEELRFVPSRSAATLASGRSRVVSVVVPSLVSWFFSSVLEGVDQGLRQHGWAVHLIDLAGRDGARRRLTARELRLGQSAAHVVIGFALDEEEQALLRSAPVPVVTVGGRIEGVRGIGIPEAEAVRLAVRHLVDLGHRRIGHIGGDREQGVNPAVAGARRRAWEAVLREEGMEPQPDWFASGAFEMEAGLTAATRLLTAPERPTAVFAASDVIAYGVLLAAQRLGLRVPEDVSVVGIDDHPFAAAYGLTTVRQRPDEQGARAATLLLRDLGAVRRPVGEEPAPVELVVRTSTAPPA